MTLNLITVGKISFIFLAAELLSLVVYFNFLTANLAWTLILVLTAVLALYKLEYGLYFVLAELFLCGKGYLFFGDFGGGRISIRIALFVIILAIWLGQLIYTWIKQKKFPDNYFTIQKSSLFKYFVVLGVVLVWGFVWGYLRGNGFSNVFLDFNAYPYFLYLLPFYDVFSQKDFSKIMELLAAAVILIFVKTTVVFLLFTQNAADSILNPLYSWLRNTGVGEITYAGNGTTNLWRVFFQSQIYSLIGLLIFFYAAIKNWANSSKAQKIFYWLLIVLTSWTVVLSLSRSFWVGGVAALGCLLLYSLIWQRQIF
ncbi:MAG: hypothetical protein NTY61_03530, partial [Candidatus Parcubacteria bacterium]|nr:hypothetical protein [Candidatus Parcubacteria bacterium]